MNTIRNLCRILIVGFAVLLLPACQLMTPSPAPAVTSPIPVTSPQATTAPSPTALPASPQVTATPAAAPGAAINVFMIVLGDNGVHGKLVGCGDSAVPVQVENPPAGEPLESAYRALLSIHDQIVGNLGYYNALYQSNLNLESAKIEGNTATILLSGTIQQGGECDSPRLKAQLEETALQFPGVDSVNVFVNGEALDDLLSLRGN